MQRGVDLHGDWKRKRARLFDDENLGGGGEGVSCSGFVEVTELGVCVAVARKA
jgi:hypothetical protein